jgi:hypothetical protein
MTTTTTLTERYISATIRSLRPETQDDVRAELEASIADAIEARTEQGEAPEEAERAVLTELGDPGILAAGYADRPLYLIGPRFYLTWWRLLKLLLIIVPVCVLGGVALGQTISGAPVGEIISTSILATGGAILHIGFWTTLVFVILERTNSATAIEKWDIDQLPEPTQDGAGRNELIATLVFLGISVGAVLWDQFRGFVSVDGEGLPILNPQLWPWTIGLLFLINAAEVVFAVVLYRKRRWSAGLAVVNTILGLAFLAWVLVLLIGGELVNPDFLAHITAAGGEGFAAGQAESADEGGVFRILAVLLGFGVAIGVGWNIVDGWIKTARARRA